MFPRIYDRVAATIAGLRLPLDGLVGAPQARRPPRAPARRGRAEPRCCSSSTAARRLRAVPASSSSSTEADNKSQVHVLEAIGDSPAATRELWRYPPRDRLGRRDPAASSCRADHPLLPARAAAEPARLEGLRRPLAAARRRRCGALGPRRRGRRPRHASTSAADPDLPGQRRHVDGRGRVGAPVEPPRGRPARRAGARLRLPRRLHVRRARARRPRRGGRARRHRPRRRALPRRRRSPGAPRSSRGSLATWS